ncbi:putative ABC transporter membrane protein [Actinacidiphila reveromycinica]|uniref:Putative ABC transporter membrane protein n=1 Tax=Actinacidiphila reveromycinica TaxID=659352 RepID=A0A7U3V0Y3_9ACTN|nr:ABC transporter permease [Streptomyces sp. SN-593]BBB02292.1 putative ABC transporter membrane protein [Streptomyces sp. SN-593]
MSAPALPAAGRGPASRLTQAWVLALRSVTLLGRDTAEIAGALITPLVFFAGFYVPMRGVMEQRGIDYVQWLPPIVVLQAMIFVAMSSADAVAADVQQGMVTRFRTMPLGRLAPVAGRLGADLCRAVLALATAVGTAAAFGFRFRAGPGPAVGFAVLALAFALCLAVGCVALGLAVGNPEYTASAMLVPQLLLTMLSTGFTPVSGFPGWIRPFVRNQPVSQAADALRSLAAGGPTARPVTITCVWLVALLAAFTWLVHRVLGRMNRTKGRRR